MITDWQRARERFNHGTVPAIIRDLYRGDPASLRLISQDYNIVYRFEAAGRGYYLRVCHVSLHPMPEARAVMRFLRFLAAENVPVGAPVPSINNAYIETLADGYYAAAQVEAPGINLERRLLDLSVYQAWGRSLGKLHAASRRFQPEPVSDYQFPSVQRFWRNIEPTIRGSAPEIQRVYAELSDWMGSLPDHDYGLIHGDYRPGNVIWDGVTARTIDFDEPNFHWYIADVCRALLELHEQPLALRRRHREAFMRGYSSEHQIDDWWLSQLPYFAQHRALLMHAWDVQEGGDWSGVLDWVLNRVGW